MNLDTNPAKGHITMATAGIIWGLNAPIAKAVMLSVSALSLTTFRMAGGAVCFWIASLFIKNETVPPKDMLRIFFASLLGVVFNQGLFIFGLSQTTPSNAAIVTTMLPIVTMIVAAIYLKEPITNKKVLGIFMGAIGAFLLIISNGGSSSGNSNSIIGDICCMISQFSVAIYLTLYKDLFTKYSPITVSKWMFTYASICFIPFSFSDVTSTEFTTLNISTIAGISFVVIGATFIAYLFMQIAQKNLRPTVVSMYNYLQPIVASIIAYYLGMDSFGWMKWVAIALVFCGVYVVTQSKSRAQLEAEQKIK